MPDQQPQPLRQTTVQFSPPIPGTAQYKGAKWDGLRTTTPGSTLEQAQAYAKNNPSVSYFFHMKNAMTLEQVRDPDGNLNSTKTFNANDAVFLGGEHFWLGSATGMSDTYLVNERYDLTDPATKDDILKPLRDRFLIWGVDASTGTRATPKRVTAGWVFVDFSDVTGDDIPALRAKLEGPAPDNQPGNSALKAFISRESNGRVELTVETYSDNKPGSTGWVRLSKLHSAYEGKYETIANEVDGLIDFPDNWDIILFAFPDKDPTPANVATDGNAAVYELGADYWIDHSRCITGTVDQNTKIPIAFMDPSHYNDQLGAHITTIHEIMHAFRLPDLYYNDTYRSYGWSMMSACGAGWHITQFEKLMLGWEDPDQFIFLKRGILYADELKAGTKKGIVILPDGKREDTYFIELAQEIGDGETNRNQYNTDNQADYGLLLMTLRADGAEGRLIPYVCDRSPMIQKDGQAIDSRTLYGGANEAPFKQSDAFSTNGIFSFPIAEWQAATGTLITRRLIGVDGAYTPPDTATVLRENDRIALGDEVFMLTTSGQLKFDSPTHDGGCVDANNNLTSLVNLYNTDYGYVAYVDTDGIFCVAKAVDTKHLEGMVLNRFPTPSGVTLTTGEYYFKIEKTNGETGVNVYKKGVADKAYTVFRKQ